MMLATILKGSIMMLVLVISCVVAEAQTPESYIIKALTHHQKGEDEKALQTYDEGISLYPKVPMLYVLKGELLSKTERRLTNNEGNYSLAIKQFDLALSIDSTYFPAHNSKALTNLFHQKYDLAIHDFERSYQYAENPNEKFKVLADLGAAKLYSKDYSGAMDVFERALKMRPNETGLLLNIAVMEMNLGNYQKAEEMMLKAESTDPKRIEILNNMGLLYIKMERLNDAIMKLEKAKKLAPDDAYVYNNLGLAKVKKGKAKEGLKLVNKSLAMYPDNSYAYKNRALAYIAMGDLSEACKDLQHAIELGYSTTFDSEASELQDKYCKH